MKRPARLSQIVVSLGMTFAMSAEALTLGKLTVLSSLGQPLVAEIEVPEISPEESNSIRVGMASAEAFKSAGLDYTSAVSQINVIGKRRADGRAILELRSSQPISAPYLDLVLEVIWNNGRMLRDYTVLLDPPATSAQALVIPAPTLPIQTMSIAPVAQPIPAAVQPAPTELVPAPVAVTPKSVPLPAITSGRNQRTNPRPAELTTKRGDTAAAIAAGMKPDGVSLDQMLVAMLRSNPDAFVAGNVNRLKSGVVIETPSEESIRAASQSEAKSSIQAQARDFNDYRRKLSSNVGVADAGQPARSASGKVVAEVAERKAVAPTDDRLTLAKPNAGTKAASSETKIAQERASAEASARRTELQKNIAELGKLNAAVSAGASTAPAPAPAVAAASSAPVVTPPVVPVPAATLPKPTRPVLPAPQEVSFLDQMILNPLTLPIAGGVGILVLLAGWLGIRRRRASAFGVTQNSTQNFAATRQPSDTIFGPMGASDVDTKEAPASTTMVYSPSQSSPTTGDVDPIAEADVYLAYNRDVQAEEILKSAKVDFPKRTDVQVKLLELYAKRLDLDSFNLGAQDLHLITDGAGTDWARVRQMAKDINSAHPLFNSVPTAMQTPVSEAPTKPSAGLIDFAPSTYSLDLPDFTETAPVHASIPMAAFSPTMPPVLSPIDDPKLALAEEYVSVGDLVGARALIDEVIARNTNPQTVTQAHQMLAKLG
jgi:pilus assembly protein FimV